MSHALYTAIYATVHAILMYYFFYVLQLQMIIFPLSIILLTIFINLYIRIPFLMSGIVSICAALLSGMLEVGVSMLWFWLKITDSLTFYTDRVNLALQLLTTCALLLLLVFIVQKYKLGFIFKERDFQFKGYLKPYNYLVSILLLIVLFLVSISILNFSLTTYQIVAFIVLAVSSALFMGLSYLKNKETLIKYDSKRRN